MLEAVARGKTKPDRLTGGFGRQPREDVITSAIFGPLRLISDPWLALDALLGRPQPEQAWTGASSLSIDLWRRFGTQEPDVILTASFPDRAPLRVLVEVKWGADLGARQLPRYIEAMAEASMAPDRIVLLGCEPKHRPVLEEEGLGAEPRTWRDAARDLRRLRGGSGAPSLWADAVFSFLQRTEKGHLFSGFSAQDCVVPDRVLWDIGHRSARPFVDGTIPVEPIIFAPSGRHQAHE